jgi:phosphoribosyl-AMP cyclohydrolase
MFGVAVERSGCRHAGACLAGILFDDVGSASAPMSNEGTLVLEEGTVLQLDFGKLALIASHGMKVVPAVIQQHDTLEVLMVGYVNDEALKLMQATGQLVLWSTSRNELWRKGATSGDTVSVREIRVNCEQNSLLLLVEKTRNGICHTRTEDGVTRPGCYYRVLTGSSALAPMGEVRGG